MAKKIFKLYTLLLFTTLFIHCRSVSPNEKTSISHDNNFSFEEVTIDQLRAGYEKGTYTIASVTQAYLDRIAAIDDAGPQLNAVIELNPDALSIAQTLDEELKAGKVRGPLHGIPVLLKDNIDTADKMSTTAGSRALIGSKPLKDSRITEKLRLAGAVILGKANLSEWANFRGELSSSGWSGVGGQTKNPYRTDRNPCGSSSGSGVAVSANLCVIAIGTETNGSIVCPSSASGIVGIKPTVGLLSRSGIIPISFTQDTPGPMARTVRDAAIALGTMVGVDEADSKTIASEGKFYTDYSPFLKEDGVIGKRIGLYKRPFGRHPKVDELTLQAVEKLKSMGAEIIEIDQIYPANARSASFQVMLYEYKDGLNKYFSSLGEKAPIQNLEALIAFNKKDSVELRFYGQEFLEMAQEKNGLEDEAYQKALATMKKGSQELGIDRVMETHKLDAIIAPTGSPAWKTDWVNGDAFHVGSSSPAAMAGYPNISVPMGFIDELPVGLSFFGKAWSEPLLLEIAYAFEQETKIRKSPVFLPN